MNTDCLSRKAVLDTLDTTDKFLDEDRTVENYKALLKECYEVLTPVTPPSEDCVSRQAVVEYIKASDADLGHDSENELVVKDILNMPPVTPTHIETVTEFADRCRECGKQKTKWIPVSEKLPEEDGDYLLWGKIDEDEDEYTFIGSYDSGCEEFGIWQEQFDRTTLGCLGSDFFEYASVIAWMPLPEPYKAESEGKE